MTKKRIVIIGGSSGIGLATAKQAAERDFEIVIASRSEEKLEIAKKEIKGSVATYALDINIEDDIKNFFPKIGPFDYLVVTAGVSVNGSCLDLDSIIAKLSFNAKFWGQYFAVKYGAPFMNKVGAIVLFAGVFSQRPTHNTAVMSSVNGAIESLGRALAVELAPIRVNVISPGMTDTPRISHLSQNDREAFLKKISDQILVDRIAEPEDIAQGVLYLLGSSYTTGTTLIIDGGYLVHH